MRLRLATEKPGKSTWDIKLIRGGMLDIEFIAQAIVLLNFNDCPNEATYDAIEVLDIARDRGFFAV